MQLFTQLGLAVRNGRKFFPLVQNLVSREMKKKYRRSILGYIWCVLNPLLVMLILNAVFSTMFHNSIENYPVYLFTGRMIYTFITTSTQSVERSIRSNGPLLRKARIPIYVFPLANFSTAVVDFGFNCVAFIIVLLFTRTPVSIHALFLPVLLAQLFTFCFGLGLVLAQCSARVRDTDFLYPAFCTAWMYLTPVFYPIASLPEGLRSAITNWNPAYFYVQQMRDLFLYHQWPEAGLFWHGTAAALLFLAIGLTSYWKSRDTLILYV